MGTLIVNQEQDYFTSSTNLYLVRSQLFLLNVGVATPEEFGWVVFDDQPYTAHIYLNTDLGTSVYVGGNLVFSGTWSEYHALPYYECGVFQCEACPIVK